MEKRQQRLENMTKKASKHNGPTCTWAKRCNFLHPPVVREWFSLTLAFYPYPILEGAQ